MSFKKEVLVRARREGLEHNLLGLKQVPKRYQLGQATLWTLMTSYNCVLYRFPQMYDAINITFDSTLDLS